MSWSDMFLEGYEGRTRDAAEISVNPSTRSGVVRPATIVLTDRLLTLQNVLFILRRAKLHIRESHRTDRGPLPAWIRTDSEYLLTAIEDAILAEKALVNLQLMYQTRPVVR